MFANVYYVPLVWGAALIFMVLICWWVILFIAKKTMDKEYGNFKLVANIMAGLAILVITLGGLVSFFKTVAVQETPRSVIDRSNVERQQQKYEKSLKEEER